MSTLGYYREMQRICEGMRKRDPGVPDPARLTAAMLKDNTVSGDNLSLRRLYEATVPRGREIIDSIDYHRKGGGFRLMEMEGAPVASDVFSKVTGQFLYDRMLKEYNHADVIWPKLVTEEETRFPRGEKEPRITEMGDEFSDNVSEGEPAPAMTLGADWVEYPATNKFIRQITITEETLVEDRSGDIMKYAGNGGKWVSIQKDKRVITTATGSTGGNTYKYRNEAAINAYQTSTPFVNSHVNALVDHTDINQAMLLFDAMTDPATGEFLSVPKPDILVPTALVAQAYAIKNAMQLMQVDNTAVANAVRMQFPNVIGPVWPVGDIITNPRVKSITTSASTWFLGDFKNALVWKYWKKLTVEALPPDNYQFKVRGIVAGFIFGEAGVCGWREPRLVTKNTAS